jgi:hypothetical protein
MLDGISVANLTPAALLGIAILMLFLGRLIPSSLHREKVEECDRWRMAYESEREAKRISDAQTAELLELAKTTHALISAIVRTPTPTQRSSGGSDAPMAT